MLLAVLIALGVLAVPVECARAAGPHSVFVPAADIARLQAAAATTGPTDGADAAAHAGHAGAPAGYADPPAVDAGHAGAFANHAGMPTHHTTHPTGHAHGHGVAGGHPAPAIAGDPDLQPVRADATHDAARTLAARALPVSTSKAAFRMLPESAAKALPQAAPKALPETALDERPAEPSGALPDHADAALGSAAALAPARLVLTPPDPDGARLLFAEPVSSPGWPGPGPEAPPP
jgi:hypothetical protein